MVLIPTADKVNSLVGWSSLVIVSSFSILLLNLCSFPKAVTITMCSMMKPNLPFQTQPVAVKASVRHIQMYMQQKSMVHECVAGC